MFTDDGRNLGYQSLVALSCDDNSGTNGLTSTVTIPVSQGTNYYVMVDGVNGVSGRVSLNYLLDSAPKISSIVAQTINENQSTAWIPFTISDRETAAAQLAVSGVCNNSSFVAPTGFEFSGSGSNRQMRITPQRDVFGTNLVGIIVTDALGGIRTTQFMLCVVRVPRLLEIASALEAGIASTPYSAQIVAVGGTGPYRFTFASAAPTGWTLTTNGILAGSAPSACTNVFDVRVTDNAGASVTRTLPLQIIDPIRLTAVNDGTGLSFRFTGRPVRSYVLEMTTEIGSGVWTPLSTNSSPSGQLQIPIVQGTGPSAFFRVREQ